MPIKTASRTIQGLEVKTTQLGAERALVLLARLLRAFGPLLEGMAGKSPEDDATPVIISALGELEPAEVPALAKEILAHTMIVCDGEAHDMGTPVNFDKVFSGAGLRYLPPVLGFVLQENYGGFFADALAKKQAQKETASASKSPKDAATPGPSGDCG